METQKARDCRQRTYAFSTPLSDVLGSGALTVKYLSWNARQEYLRRFAEQYGYLAAGKQRKILSDFVELSPEKYDLKYTPENE